MLVRRSALPSLVTVTVAPGIAACCALRTNPEIWPASNCAAAVEGIAAVNATRTNRQPPLEWHGNVRVLILLSNVVVNRRGVRHRRCDRARLAGATSD